MIAPASDSKASGGPAHRGSGPLAFLGRWFRSVRLPHGIEDDLARAATGGSVVFVMRTAGLLNFLWLAWIASRFHLPPLRAALGLTGVMPWLARVHGSAEALDDAVRRGETAVVFLSRSSGPDPFPLLSRLQRELERPVLLVPALLLWTRRPQRLRPGLGDLLFGTPDRPSRLANAVGFLLNRERAVFTLGRPLDLAQLQRERGGAPDATVSRVARGALHLHLAREARAVIGPPLKTADRVRELVLRDRHLRDVLARVAADEARPLAGVEAEARRDLDEIASRFSPAFIEIARPVLAWLFRRMYDAVEVDEAGLARVRRMAAGAPLVLCPSHKSHIDYLVLSLVFYEHGLTPPHVAAGINLAFWPFGAIARRGGAFFIRRTVKGDRVYTATLRAYVKRLLRDRFPQEFYLEGGRSRTGKMLFPKTGLFSMEVDAWLDGAAEDVLFVPVAIDYEQLMEARAYARELSGGEKRKESLGSLLRARKVLGRRYGRLYIQFEEPISLRELAARRLGPAASSLTLEEVMDAPGAAAGAREENAPRSADPRRQLVQALANHAAWRIQRAITVTPIGLVAAALLSHVRRGLPANELAGRVALLRSLAAASGARFAKELAAAPADPALPGPVADALASLVAQHLVRVEEAAGTVVYSVPEERRLQLDFHRNTVLHRFVPHALVAAALRARDLDADEADVKEEARFLSRLLKLEFMYRVGASLDEVFAETVAQLERHSVIARRGEALHAGDDREALEFLADLVRPYLEAYRVAAAMLAELDPGAALDRRALARAFLERGQAAFLSGRIALRESVSRPVCENAVEWFVHQKALVPSGDLLAVAPGWREERLPALIASIDRSIS